MRKIDEISLQIDAFLRKKYSELSKEVGPYSNIIGVFYHETMIYFSNFVIIRESEYKYSQDIEFPYLNSEYVNNPFALIHQLGNIHYSHSWKQIVAIILIKCRNLLSFFLRKNSLAIIYPKLDNIKLALLLPLNIKINFIQNNKCYICKKDKQIKFFEDTLYELANILKISNKDHFVSNFINYITSFITDSIPKINSDFLLVGSNSNLENRINSTNFLNQNKKVISLAHGEACFSLLDDPYTGYGEFSYSDFYITFGCQFLGTNKYNKSLHKIPQIYQRSSKIVENIFNDSPIRYTYLNNKCRVLYIPTGFSDNKRYGPFRDLDDEVYLEWQNAICNSGYNIFYKARPSTENKVKIDEVKYLFKDLKKNKNYFKDYDLYIVDFFSTASTLVCATNKPIIYFNLGLMNIAEEALNDFKARVYWYDIELEADFQSQIKDAINRYNNSETNFVNNFTKKYCLNDRNKSSDIEIVKHIIDSD